MTSFGFSFISNSELNHIATKNSQFRIVPILQFWLNRV